MTMEDKQELYVVYENPNTANSNSTLDLFDLFIGKKIAETGLPPIYGVFTDYIACLKFVNEQNRIAEIRGKNKLSVYQINPNEPICEYPAFNWICFSGCIRTDDKFSKYDSSIPEDNVMEEITHNGSYWTNELTVWSDLSEIMVERYSKYNEIRYRIYMKTDHPTLQKQKDIEVMRSVLCALIKFGIRSTKIGEFSLWDILGDPNVKAEDAFLDSKVNISTILGTSYVNRMKPEMTHKVLTAAFELLDELMKSQDSYLHNILGKE